jgi:HPt (histidine-containing phosphotransfer) domain-containing protein
MSSRLEQARQRLQRVYRAGLADKAAVLSADAAALPGDAEAAARIRQLAHQLAGSGASYGFPAISDAARDAERADNDALADATGRLIEALRRCAADAS